ncbi:class I SAM-dependent rRNA methyltransferase [Amphibacillus sediminis]|uniref:class I SAM-dependent rRNA methyltransferase n=1 Tax=Amphibacillus sediminis TaxID=360185 RepID=UPI00082966B2|nr:class I SAM-dependent rRNA methyltransferase [Amphibacillus sediminis]
MQTVKIKNKYVSKYRGGYPHLFKEAIIDPTALEQEGTVIDLIEQGGKFLARGYYGRQNKGYGWVLTQNKSETIDQLFFSNKIATAVTKRDTFFSDDQTNAFRLFNGEGDGIGGLTIDYYAGFLLITWYSQGIYQFKSYVLEALEQSLTYQGIYQKKRFDTGGKYIDDDDFVKGKRAEWPLLIKENGINYAVHLNEGPMTGIFLDQREVRKAIKGHVAKDKTVLNTFSYTGAFSVSAALGGAIKTTSVDLANRSLAKTIEQFTVNHLDHNKHEIKVMDVFRYFNYAKKHQLNFDLVILDPPSFARSKKHTFSVAKDYVKLLEEAIAITSDGGMIIASTNYSGIQLKKFKQFIEQAFTNLNEKYQIKETFRLPFDFQTDKQFPEGNYLKVIFIEKVRG